MSKSAASKQRRKKGREETVARPGVLDGGAVVVYEERGWGKNTASGVEQVERDEVAHDTQEGGGEIGKGGSGVETDRKSVV